STQTSASTSSYLFSTRSFASLSIDLIVGSIRGSECGPRGLHFLLHSSCFVPPAYSLPAYFQAKFSRFVGRHQWQHLRQHGAGRASQSTRDRLLAAASLQVQKR